MHLHEPGANASPMVTVTALYPDRGPEQPLRPVGSGPGTTIQPLAF